MTDIRLDTLYRRTAFRYAVHPLQYIGVKQYIEDYVRHAIDQECAAEYVSLTWNHVEEPLEMYECTAIAWEPIAPVENITQITIPRRNLNNPEIEERIRSLVWRGRYYG